MSRFLEPGAHFARDARGTWRRCSKERCDWHQSCVTERVLKEVRRGRAA